MNTINHNISLSSNAGEIYKIESFVESICDELGIYSNYFGNIIVSLSTVFEECLRLNSTGFDLLDISFYNDSEGLVFRIEPKSTQIIEEINSIRSQNNLIWEKEEFNWFLIISKLADSITIEENKIIILNAL